MSLSPAPLANVNNHFGGSMPLQVPSFTLTPGTDLII